MTFWRFWRPKPPKPPMPQPPIGPVSRLSVWVGGALKAVGQATVTLDQTQNVVQYFGVPESAGPSGASRWRFDFPEGIIPGWGGHLTIDQVPGYLPYSARCVIVPDMTDIALLPAATWPATPTRDDVCAVRIGFQGVTVHTAEFGAFPAFGPETSSLAESDLASYLDQMKAAGWSHVEFAVSWNYHSASYSYPVPGRDLSQNLPELKRRIEIAIRKGFKVCLFCAGDGLGAGPGYNDPVGWTYGREWLLANFQRIYDAMGPTAESAHDCRPFMGFVPGYDGTDSYGDAWKTADNVVEWWQLARRIIDAGGVGYLGQEYSAGHCQIGGRWDGEATYVNGPGQALDFILQEYPAGPPMPTNDPGAVWQINGRMVSPYHRPPQQTDDPHPPYYLREGTPRGPYFFVAYEYDTYHWVRGQVSAATVASDRAYLAALGCGIVC